MRRPLRTMALVSLLVFAASTQATARTRRVRSAVNQIQVPPTQQDFLEWLHGVDQTEIHLGQLAQVNSSDPAVRRYGKMLVRDHTAIDVKIQAFAKAKGWTLGPFLPTTALGQKMRTADRAVGSELHAMTGPMFDHTFLAAMVTGHDAAIATIIAGMRQFPDTDALLRPAVRALHKHRVRAWRLLGRMKLQNV